MEYTPSYITRAMSTDGSIRMIFADTAAICAEAARIHGTSKTMTAALGRVLTAGSLMGSLLKDADNSLTLQFRGNGPAGIVMCVSDYMGFVRGYAEDPTVELAPNSVGKLDVGGAIGNTGTLCVIRDMGLSEPYIGMSPIVSGEVGDDITEYFASSEQTPTVCALGVRVNTDLTVKSAGGFLLQLLPGADEVLIPKIEENIGKMDSVSELLAAGAKDTDVIGAALAGIDYDIFDSFETSYKCDCCRDRYLRGLIGLPEKDKEELRSSGESVETVCRFCGKKYTFEVSEF